MSDSNFEKWYAQNVPFAPFTAKQVAREAYAAGVSDTAPIDMVLHCPQCKHQHIDKPEQHDADENEPSRPGGLWNNPPHRTHLCGACGHEWRPANVPTNGVEKLPAD